MGARGNVKIWIDDGGKNLIVDDAGTLRTITPALLGVLAQLTASAAELNAISGGGLSASELAVLDGVTAGAVTASKALVVDASRDLATLGNVTLDGNLISGSTTLSETELAYLDGLTAGTVAGSKAPVVDSNLDIGDFRNVGYSGTLTGKAGAAAAAIALRLGASATEGLEVRVIDETVTCDAVSKDLTEDVPDGAVLLSVQGNKETAGAAAGTTTNWSIGTVANPDLYSPTVGALTLDAKIDHIPDWAVLSGAADIQVHGVTGAGAIGDSAPGGTARVRIVYLALNSLDNA